MNNSNVIIPYDNLFDSVIISTDNNYISGESKEINLSIVLVTIILLLFVIYFLIWGIYNYI